MGTIGRREIFDGLRRIGIEAGDVVFFHSSLKSFGAPVDGGADAVIDAVIDAVSPGGTAAVPTHTDASTEPFDPRTTLPYPGLGVVPRVFMARPDAVRSCHPTHSDAAIGPEAEWLVEGHERCRGAGEGSPLDKLRRHPRGKVLLVGVGLNRLTIIHLAESLAGVPYAGHKWLETDPDVLPVRYRDGQLLPYANTGTPGCSEAFGRAEPVFMERGLVRETRVGDARVWTMPASGVVEATMDILRKDVRFFMNPPDHCDWCRRANLKMQGE